MLLTRHQQQQRVGRSRGSPPRRPTLAPPPRAGAPSSTTTATSRVVGTPASAPAPTPQQTKPPPPRLSGASSGASGRPGPARPGKGKMEDAHVLAALTPCTGEPTAGGWRGAAAGAAAGASAPLAFGGASASSSGEDGDGSGHMQVLSNGGGVALARLGPRAGLRVPLSPAAALALGTGSSSGGSSGNVSSADDSDGANSSSNSAGGPPHLLLAGVFDGHAGHHTARQAALHLPRLVHAALVREQTALLRRGVFGGGRRGGAAAAASSCLSGAEAAADAAEAALALAFPAFDRWWADARCDPLLTRHGWDDSGSTAVVALLSGERLALANVGDSVALLVRPTGGNSSSDNFVRRLTVLHRADNEEEAARVLSAGGRILSHVGPGGAMRCAASPSASDGDDNNNDEASTQPRPRPRISGMTSNTRYRSAAVTRALGDFAFKAPHPLLTPEPDVVSLRLQQGDDLLLLASDGVTDTLSDEAAAEVALDAARRERKRLEAAIGARAKAWRNLAAAPGGGAGVSDAELARALRQAAARAAADAVVREAHHRGSGDDATCVAIFLDWQKG